MTSELVYGASPYGYMTIVPGRALEESLSRVEEVLAARSYGEARRLQAPGADDEQYDDADAYDVRGQGAVEDGDWPPHAGVVGFATLPAEVLEIINTEHSMVGQEWVEFDEADEQRVVDLVQSLGHPIRRDDAAIAQFDGILDR